MAEAGIPTGNAWCGFSQMGNGILDGLLYYFSGDFAPVREIVDEYGNIDFEDRPKQYVLFREQLLNIAWTPRKAHAFISHWPTYAVDLTPSEEEMPLDVALKDRTVDCEEYRTIANALLNRNGDDETNGDAVNLYRIPEDPSDRAEGHATKIVSWTPSVVTLCNWGYINHYQSDMTFVRDFISKANCYEKVKGHWSGEDFVQDYGDLVPLEAEGPATLFQTVQKNISKFMPAPLKFDVKSLPTIDAEYMNDFIEHRNRLIRMLQIEEQGTSKYAKIVREIKIRNRLLRVKPSNMKNIQVVS